MKSSKNIKILINNVCVLNNWCVNYDIVYSDLKIFLKSFIFYRGYIYMIGDLGFYNIKLDNNNLYFYLIFLI